MDNARRCNERLVRSAYNVLCDVMVEDEKGPNMGSGVATVMILFIGLPSTIAGCIVMGVHWPRLSALWRCLGVAIPLLLLIALGLRLIQGSLYSLPKSIAW